MERCIDLQLTEEFININMNFRNHRKIVVIDNNVGFVGGFNVGDEYLGKDSKFGYWRDTHIKFTGSAVNDLNLRFLADWRYATKEEVSLEEIFEANEENSNSNNVGMQIVSSGPNLSDKYEIKMAYLKMIQKAKKYIYIQTPYLLPTEPILMALKTAALAGVDVRIMIPARADTWITHLGSLSYLDDIMRAGVRIYLYQKGFLHSKLMVSDDTLSTVGSTNMDFRSFEHNFEVNAFMYDPSSALLLKGIFLQDQKDAILLQRKTWIKRPWYQKAQESIVRLLAPLL